MFVQTFKTAFEYKEFMNYLEYQIEVINVIVFDNQIVLTYKIL
jgi:hypothetical protein